MKPIAYQQGIAGDIIHSGECWQIREYEYWQKTGNRASIGTIFTGPDKRLKKCVCPICRKPILDKTP